MADWEAQKSFVHKTAGGVFRPSTSLTGFAAIWGWAWRFILFILVPILAYLFLVVKYAKSKEFGKSLTEETQRYFGAGETSVRAARWDMDGNLRVGVVEVKGGPGNDGKHGGAAVSHISFVLYRYFSFYFTCPGAQVAYTHDVLPFRRSFAGYFFIVAQEAKDFLFLMEE